MRRFLFALTTDVRVQLRNNLYTIGIMVALICALLMAKGEYAAIRSLQRRGL